MQCNSEKFQPGQIEFLSEIREGVNETLLQVSRKCWTEFLLGTRYSSHEFRVSISCSVDS